MAQSVNDPIDDNNVVKIKNSNKVPWQFDLTIPSKTEANNSHVLKDILRFYLQRRSLDAFLPQVEGMLQYGCWCQILKERLAGKGIPIDSYDSLCRNWQKCNEVRVNTVANGVLTDNLTFQCAVMDYGDSSESCSAATTPYELSLSTVTDRIVCDRTSDLCGKAICQCDERISGSARNLFLFYTN